MAQPVIRVPNLNVGKMVDEQGMATIEEMSFRQTLLTSLQQNFGNEGLVAPTQTAANITIIQDYQLENKEYSCQYGTIIFNSTANSIMIAVNDGTGKPIFKTVTLT